MTDLTIQPLLPTDPAVVLAELKRSVCITPVPAPCEALDFLSEVASRDTGSSQAIRSFLFWLAGLPDPTGYVGTGALELRRTDSQVRLAALAVFSWWIGPARSDLPLLERLSMLQARFTPG
jgi:hypothetical protein